VTSEAVLANEQFRVRDGVALPLPRTEVRARAERRDEYPIIVTRSFEETVIRLQELLDGAQVALITDETVHRLHGERVHDALRDAGNPCQVYRLPPGEVSKSVSEATKLWDWLADRQIARRDFIVALGGGVVSDLGGWVASAYMRGIHYINLPTTLLAQVDGAMGGKVAANHPSAKNLLGAFYQPSGVISNVAFLATLDDRHVRAGLAESIKKAVIASPAYWDFIEQNAEQILEKDPDALERLVSCAAAIKTVLVERDPYEEDLRRPLNFGHTIGHPLETVTGYGPLLHGEAVAFGMVVESRIAASRGLFPEADLGRLIALLARVGLPYCAERLPVSVDADAVVGAMGMVRRIRAGSLRYVLPVVFGETIIADDVSDSEVRAALCASGVTTDGHLLSDEGQ
jgi:3-dehydroquinate synthase